MIIIISLIWSLKSLVCQMPFIASFGGIEEKALFVLLSVIETNNNALTDLQIFIIILAYLSDNI